MDTRGQEEEGSPTHHMTWNSRNGKEQAGLGVMDIRGQAEEGSPTHHMAHNKVSWESWTAAELVIPNTWLVNHPFLQS